MLGSVKGKTFGGSLWKSGQKLWVGEGVIRPRCQVLGFKVEGNQRRWWRESACASLARKISLSIQLPFFV